MKHYDPALKEWISMFSNKSPQDLEVGFVGLGVMGQGMARRLLLRGHRLAVFGRRPEVLDAFRAAGAQVAADLAELGARCDVVFTCLPEASDLEQVLFGSAGLAAHLRPGACVVDTSTISASSAREIGQRLAGAQLHFLDAPISGGQAGAEQGTLTCMVGGREDVFAACEALISAFATNIFHTGAQGTGQAVKACNQVCVTAALLGVAEALSIARSAGVDPHLMRKVLLTATARSTVLERHALRVIAGDFKPGFRASLMLKDLKLARATAEESSIELPVARIATDLLEALCNDQNAGLDWLAIASDKSTRQASPA